MVLPALLFKLLSRGCCDTITPMALLGCRADCVMLPIHCARFVAMRSATRAMIAFPCDQGSETRA